MKTKHTPTQLRVLQAATAGRVSQARAGVTWREFPEKASSRERRRIGRAVTASAEILIANGFARKSPDVDKDDRRPLIVTADGYELLSEVSHRG